MEYRKPKSANNGSDSKDWPEEIDWRPEGPDELVGILKRKQYVKTKFGHVHKLVIEDSEGNLNAVWCNRTALKNLVEENEADLLVGRVVGIKSEGKITLDDGRTFYPYEMGFGEIPTPAAVPAGRSYEDDEEPF